MKKLLVITVFLMSATIGLRAQDGGGVFSFAAGANVALPIGDFADSHSFGLGVEAQGEYMFSEMFGAVFNTGYTSFFGKDIDLGGGVTVEAESVGLIPILAGARVYPSSQFFIGARAGLGIFTGSGDSNTGFAYRPEVGANLGPVQIALSYNGWSKDGGSLAHMGLVILYRFGASAAE
jgi:hypothetical protein